MVIPQQDWWDKNSYAETDYVLNKAIRSMLTLCGQHLRILNKTS